MAKSPMGAESPSDETPPARDYEVGYGRPPVAHRFQPKTSGNPGGRRPGAKNLSTLVREKMAAKVSVREGGRERKMSKAEIGVTKLVNRFAEKGDPKLFVVLMRLLEGPAALAGETGSPADELPDAGDADDILAWFTNAIRKGEGGR